MQRMQKVQKNEDASIAKSAECVRNAMSALNAKKHRKKGGEKSKKLPGMYRIHKGNEISSCKGWKECTNVEKSKVAKNAKIQGFERTISMQKRQKTQRFQRMKKGKQLTIQK